MGRLSGKTALITGGTSGIGLEAARRFVAEGARVAITGSNPTSIEQARATLGAKVLILRADAGDVGEQARIPATVGEKLGRLDVVFVNAGIGDFRPLEQWDEAAFDRSIAVNLKGPFFLIRALAPILSDHASIVLNASINAHIGMPNSSVYAATKAGLLSLAKTLSGELLHRGVRVNAVSPGPIDTPIHAKIGMDSAAVEALVSQVPAGRRGSSGEIADAVLFLASDESAFTIGREFAIDGGISTL